MVSVLFSDHPANGTCGWSWPSTSITTVGIAAPDRPPRRRPFPRTDPASGRPRRPHQRVGTGRIESRVSASGRDPEPCKLSVPRFVLVSVLRGRCPWLSARFSGWGALGHGHMADSVVAATLIQWYLRRSDGTWRYRQERTVKPSAQPTLVRTQHLPHQPEQPLTSGEAVGGCRVPVRLCPAGNGRLRLVPANTRRSFTGPPRPLRRRGGHLR